MTNLEAANARRTEAEAAMAHGDFASAARDFTLAAEQFGKVAWALGIQPSEHSDVRSMRAEASKAIRLRDAA